VPKAIIYKMYYISAGYVLEDEQVQQKAGLKNRNNHSYYSSDQL
jgi:hypothetical protein